VLAALYLLNPALHGVNTFDFHLEIFTPVFMLFAFYYLEKGRWLKGFIFIILELTTLEFAPFIIFPFGLYFLLKRIRQNASLTKGRLASFKRVLPAVALIVLSIVFLFVALFTIAAINPLKTGAPYRTWSYWGKGVLDAVTNMIRNPTDVVITLLTPIEKPYFFMLLFSTALFLPLLAPCELILTLPWLFAAFLTDYQPYYQPYFQYSALVLGQIFIAAVYGIQNLFSRIQEPSKSGMRSKIVILMIIVNLFIFLATSPVGIPAFTNRSIRPYAISTEANLSHVSELNKVIGLIPSNASIATIQDIFPHVCHSVHAYFLKWPLDYEVDYILVDVKSPTFTWGIYGPTPDVIVTKLMETNEYRPVVSSDGILLLKRGYTGLLEYYSPQVDTFDYDQLICASGQVVWDYGSTAKRIITSDPTNSLGMVWFGPYKYFVPGNYSVTFSLRISNENSQLALQVTSNEGSDIISQRVLNGTESVQLDVWQDFTLTFEIKEVARLEFRGLSLSNQTQISLDHVRVQQSPW
jgi:uncharacterized membrane protein